MVNPTSDQHLDDDILQCKADVLRAKNLIPPFGKPPKATSVTEKSAEFRVGEEKPAIIIENDRQYPTVSTEKAECAASIAQEPELIEEAFAGQEIEVVNQSELEQQEIEEITSNLEEIGESYPPVEEDAPGESWLNIMDQGAKTTEAPIDPETAIPTFNLAEQIMAEQRKLTANKRKGPASKTPIPITEFKPQPQIQSLPKITPVVHKHIECEPQDKMLSQIVSRDIERLLKGIAVF